MQGELRISLFELDAVSHEMQRHRMTIGVFYQYLLLELMRKKCPVFDGSREGDIIADIETPGFRPGLRIFMSVKKSKDTVGGQDVGGDIPQCSRQPCHFFSLNYFVLRQGWLSIHLQGAAVQA